MIKDEKFVIKRNEPLNALIYEMTLTGDTSLLTRPGQFIDIAIDGKYLRRPISVSDYAPGELTIVYKLVGEGTRKMSEMKLGESICALIALGNGFDPTVDAKKTVLIGGGVGIPPLVKLAKSLKEAGKSVTVIMGFNTAADAYYLDKFDFCDETRVTTVDGSMGIKGYATAAFDKDEYDYFYACGPEPMLEGLVRTGMDGQLSYEARMGCGFGVCMGCSCKTRLGNKRICKDGPVMTAEEMR